jgi:hypothetical protein
VAVDPGDFNFVGPSFPLGAAAPLAFDFDGPVFPLADQPSHRLPWAEAGYPFFARHPLAEVILNLHLDYKDPDRLVAPPLRVSGVYGFGAAVGPGARPAAHDRDLVIVDANGRTVFDSSLATWFNRSLWGDAREVASWVDAAGQTLAVVADTAGRGMRSDRMQPDAARLDVRTHPRAADHLVAVSDGLHALSGGVQFGAGYNVAIGVDGQTVRVDGSPGAGRGRVPGCPGEDDEAAVKRVNKVAPTTAGDFKLEPGACHRLNPVTHGTGATATQDAGVLRVGNDCEPCCPCPSYAITYKGVARTWDAWAAAAADLEKARDAHRANVDRWNAAATCRTAQPVQTVTRSTRGGRVFVGVAFCNPTDVCRENVEVRFTLVPYVNGAEALPSGKPPALVDAFLRAVADDSPLPYDPEVWLPPDKWQTFVYYAGGVPPRKSVLAQLRLIKRDAVAGHAALVFVTVHADPAAGVVPPDAPAPAGAQARWALAGGPDATDACGVAECAVAFNP